MIRFLVVLSFLALSTVAEAQTITIDPLAKSQYCSSDSATITYRATGSFDPTNVFIVQVSAPDGRFDGWQTVGRSSLPSGTIPFMFTGGGSFRVRVAGTSPYVVSDDNGTTINVIALPTPSVSAVEPWGGSMDIGTNARIQAFVGIEDAPTLIKDQYDSTYTHHWTFNQDANISTSTLADPQVIWSSPGEKTGLVTTANSNGCSDTSSFAVFLESCKPIIPKGAHIVTGTETGDFQTVWVKPGGSYTGGGGQVFVEPGGQVFTTGHPDIGIAYVRRNGSFVMGPEGFVNYAVLDTGASVSCTQNCYFLHCDSLQFDYTNILGDVPPTLPDNVTIHEESGRLYVHSDQDPIRLRLVSLLGTELMSLRGEGSLDVDLSQFPAGMYLGLVQAGDERMVRRVLVTH